VSLVALVLVSLSTQLFPVNVLFSDSAILLRNNCGPGNMSLLTFKIITCFTTIVFSYTFRMTRRVFEVRFQ